MVNNVTISSSAIVYAETQITGKVSIGEGCVVHPYAVFDAKSGPIIIGENNIFEEFTIIRNESDNQPMIIGDLNIFQVRSQCRAKYVGSRNIIGIRALLDSGSFISDDCCVAADSKVEAKQTLEPFISVYGTSNQIRKTASQNLVMASTRVAATLPRISVTIGHVPQKLKTGGIEPSSRARLEVLRRIVTRVVREERVELKWNRAVEARPYLERLIQLGVERGPLDEYTSEMMEWWLPEKDLIVKMHEVIVPRFTDRQSPYTSIFRLPPKRLQQFVQNKREWWKRYEIAVLEIDGNPFPAVMAGNVKEEGESKNILNILLTDALRNQQQSNIAEK